MSSEEDEESSWQPFHKRIHSSSNGNPTNEPTRPTRPTPYVNPTSSAAMNRRSKRIDENNDEGFTNRRGSYAGLGMHDSDDDDDEDDSDNDNDDDDDDDTMYGGRGKTISRRTKQTKEERMLGIFQEEDSDDNQDDDDDDGTHGRSRRSRSGKKGGSYVNKPVSFVSSSSSSSSSAHPNDKSQMNDDDEEDTTKDERKMHKRPRPADDEEMSTYHGQSQPYRGGLGFRTRDEAAKEEEENEHEPESKQKNNSASSSSTSFPFSSFSSGGTTNSMFRDLLSQVNANTVEDTVMNETQVTPVVSSSSSSSIPTASTVKPQFSSSSFTDSSIGSFEKHTKGFGAKYLAKFNFSGRLGKNEQGVTAPLEVTVRPNQLGLGYGGFKEASKLKTNQIIEQEYRGEEAMAATKEKIRKALGEGTDDEDEDGTTKPASSISRKISAVPKKKEPKIVYKTATELLAAKEAQSFGISSSSSSAGLVIDMRGPQVRVHTSLQESIQQDYPHDESNDRTMDSLSSPHARIGKELLHNLNLLVEMTESDLTLTYRKQRTLEARIHELQREMEYLTVQYGSIQHVTSTIQHLSTAVTECIETVRLKLNEMDLYCTPVINNATASSSSSSVVASSSTKSRTSHVTSIDYCVSILDQFYQRIQHIMQENNELLCIQQNIGSCIPSVLYLVLSTLCSNDKYPWILPLRDRTANTPTSSSAPASTVPNVFDTQVKDKSFLKLCTVLRKFSELLGNQISRLQRYQQQYTIDPASVTDAQGFVSRITSSDWLKYSEYLFYNRLQFFNILEHTLLQYLQTSIKDNVLFDIRNPRPLLALLKVLAPEYLLRQGCNDSSTGSTGTLLDQNIHQLSFEKQLADTVKNDLVLPSTYTQFIEYTILPLLLHAVEQWNPKIDPLPIQDWTLPFMNNLYVGTNRMGSVIWPIVRQKLQTTLQEWHPSDASAYTILLPWSKVWRKDHSFDQLLIRSIIPKLITILREIDYTGTFLNNQERSRHYASSTGTFTVWQIADEPTKGIEPYHWIQLWYPLLPVSHTRALLEGEFFPRWFECLCHALQLVNVPPDDTNLSIVPEPRYGSISQWYQNWKTVFTSSPLFTEMVTLPSYFYTALELMNISMNTNYQDKRSRLNSITEGKRLLNNLYQPIIPNEILRGWKMAGSTSSGGGGGAEGISNSYCWVYMNYPRMLDIYRYNQTAKDRRINAETEATDRMVIDDDTVTASSSSSTPSTTSSTVRNFRTMVETILQEEDNYLVQPDIRTGTSSSSTGGVSSRMYYKIKDSGNEDIVLGTFYIEGMIIYARRTELEVDNRNHNKKSSSSNSSTGTSNVTYEPVSFPEYRKYLRKKQQELLRTTGKE